MRVIPPPGSWAEGAFPSTPSRRILQALLASSMREKTALTQVSEPLSSSGAEESRTPDLIIANDALYQLSYRPKWEGV